MIQFAINTAHHESTGYSPAFLVHGRELARPDPEDRRQGDDTTTPETRHQRLEEAFEVARIHLARAFQKQERHYNLRRREWRPQIGDTVWKKDRPLSSKNEAFNAKLAPRYTGPMKIRKIISPVIVDLRDEKGKWHRHIHIRDLKRDTGEGENAPPDE